MSSRPSVSVVVPFAGDVAQALVALALLRSLRTGPHDERILADNSGSAQRAEDVRVLRVDGERSPAHARNAGGAVSRGEWILFLDADVRAPADLLDRYFAEPVGERVGALAGEIRGAQGAATLAARYGATRNFLSQRAHLAHPFRPRAAAANLLVRREVFEALGGFAEGVRTAEDTDFCWRLQDLGWTLELRADAVVEHVYRTTVRELREQWRAYAAGRAWLATRYPGFRPEPAVRRLLRRARQGRPERVGVGSPGAALDLGPRSRLERLQFLALDVVLAIDELIGLRMRNRAERT